MLYASAVLECPKCIFKTLKKHNFFNIVLKIEDMELLIDSKNYL